MRILSSALLLFSVTALGQVTLVNGVETPLVLPAQSAPRLLSGAEGFRFEIPPGTINAWVQLEHIGDSPLLDLYVRKGADVAVAGNSITADFRNTADVKLLRIRMESSSVDAPLSPGTYFIGFGVNATVRPTTAVVSIRYVAVDPILQGTQVTVNAIGSIYLAGFAPGDSGGGGSVPLNSPALVPLAVRPGQVLEFDATGAIDIFTDGAVFRNIPPEGRFDRGITIGWDCCGIDMPAVEGPAGGLAGIFLGDQYQRIGVPRASYGMYGVAYETWVEPFLQQPFYIGNGFTPAGKRKRFVVPPGATRLFLSSFDNDVRANSGRFQVWVRPVSVSAPSPTNPVFVPGHKTINIGGFGAGGYLFNGGWVPMHSPVGIPVSPGQRLRLTADGAVSQAGLREGEVNIGPVGRLNVAQTIGVDCCGIDIPAVTVPNSSLVGMFTGNTLARLNVPRADFFSLGVREVQDLQPLLQQPFYIGDGYTPDGRLKSFTVPAGATRLHLAAATNNSQGASGGFHVTISPQVAGAPEIASGGIVNAAGFVSGPLSPGSLVSIFGSNLGAQASASSIPLPLTLGGTQVFVDDQPAPLVFVSPGQINFQLPASFPDRGPLWLAYAKRSALITVVRNGVVSVGARIELFPSRPGVFTTAPNAWVMFNTRTNQLANETNSSREGDVLIIYASGVSAVAPPVPDGAAAPTIEPLSRSTFGGSFVVAQGANETASSLLFSGLLPGFVGVHQLNVIVPPNAPKGIVDIFLQNEFGRSNSGRMRIE